MVLLADVMHKAADREWRSQASWQSWRWRGPTGRGRSTWASKSSWQLCCGGNYTLKDYHKPIAFQIPSQATLAAAPIANQVYCI